MRRAAEPARLGLACVVLAAGGSRRLGTPKQLVRFRGQPLLARALSAVRGAAPGAPIVVVLGALAPRLRALVRRTAPAARVVYNARWADGLASSLQAGLRAAPPGTTALLVTLVDQPNVDARALGRLLAAWRRRRSLAAAAWYSDRPGVPAVLPLRYARAIRALAGDSGARALLRDGPVTRVAMPEAALDVDTPADVAALHAPR